MEILATIAFWLIIFFIVVLAAVLAYVIWFAVKKGIWDTFLAGIDEFEDDIIAMAKKAEDNAIAVGKQISDGVMNAQEKVTNAFQTVSGAVTKTALLVQKKGNQAISTIKTTGDTTISKITTEFQNIGNTLTRVASTVDVTVRTAAQTSISKIQTTGAETIAKIDTGSRDAIAKIIDAYNKSSAAVTDATGRIDSTTQKIVEQIKTGADKAIQDIQNGSTGAYTTISTGATDAANKVASVVTDVANQIAAGATNTANQIAAGATNTANQIAAGATNTANQIAAGATNTANQIAAGATNAANQVVPGTTDLINKIDTGSKAAIDMIKTTGDKTVTTIRNQSQQAIAVIDSTFKALANTIAERATQVGNQIATGAMGVGSSIGALGAKLPPGAKLIGEGFQDVIIASITPLMDSLLVNLQPLSTKDTGYLGPYPIGSYKEDTATANSLKAGFRFLTLQIDYLESQKKDTTLFEAAGKPTLLIRSQDGTLLSKNSGSIQMIAQTIASTAFNSIVPQNNMPVILYLHVVRTPNPLTAPNDYLKFLSGIASQLNALAPFHLGMTPQGNFTRQKMADSLLAMPMKYLEGQVIIMSNADTSMFRNTTITQNKYSPANDLDFWVNMQVYLDTKEDANGITQLADPMAPPSAVFVSLPRILALSTSDMQAFAKKGKNRYVIAMGDRVKNPMPVQINTALNILGVNAILLDIFTPSNSDVLLISNQYSNEQFLQKPLVLQHSS